MQKITQPPATPGLTGPRSSTKATTAAQLSLKATSVGPAERVGILKLNMSHTPNTKIKKIHDDWCRENGYKPQAASVKPENLHVANTLSFKLQAERRSPKVQAPSSKPQASSRKRQAP